MAGAKCTRAASHCKGWAPLPSLQGPARQSHKWPKPDALVWRREATLISLRAFFPDWSWGREEPGIPIRVWSRRNSLRPPFGEGFSSRDTKMFQLSCSQAGSRSQGSHTMARGHTLSPGHTERKSAGTVNLIEDSRAWKPLDLTPLQGISASLPQGTIMQNEPKTINYNSRSL